MAASLTSSTPATTYLDLHETCIALLTLAHARGGALPLRTPWQLDPMVAYTMTQKGYAPPEGGWGPCVALLAAAGLFTCTDEGFVASLSVEAFGERFTHPVEVQVVMLEAWTRALVPPQLAAGMFMLLGLHPSWALKLMSSVHMHVKDAQGEALLAKKMHMRSHFDDPLIVAMGRLVFDLISDILGEFEVLSACKPQHMKSLTDTIWERVRHTQQSVLALDARVPRGRVGLCMHSQMAHLATRERCELWLGELKRDVLIPARVLTKVSATTFIMHHEVLYSRDIQVFECPKTPLSVSHATPR